MTLSEAVAYVKATEGEGLTPKEWPGPITFEWVSMPGYIPYEAPDDWDGDWACEEVLVLTPPENSPIMKAYQQFHMKKAPDDWGGDW